MAFLQSRHIASCNGTQPRLRRDAWSWAKPDWLRASGFGSIALSIAALVFWAGAAPAQEAGAQVFAPVAEAFLHPRCTNCHVGDSNQPGWDGLVYGKGAVHGMAVNAGESRIGAEGLPCRTCHVTSMAPNTLARAAPHIDEPWQLPPVALAWQGATAAELCEQLRDPGRTDGLDVPALAEHVGTSAFVAWGFAPGGGRSAPQGTPQVLAQALLAWGEAGTPCD